MAASTDDPMAPLRAAWTGDWTAARKAAGLVETLAALSANQKVL
jgi:hypothetical protein